MQQNSSLNTQTNKRLKEISTKNPNEALLQPKYLQKRSKNFH